MPADFWYHAFLTHDWGRDQYQRNNHETVKRINEALKREGIITWFDEDRMEGDIVQQMAGGLDYSVVAVCFITNRYMDKVNGDNDRDNCNLEFTYAMNQQKPSRMLAVPMEEQCLDAGKWRGKIGMSLGGRLYQCQFDQPSVADDAAFNAQVKKLIAAILQVCGRM